MLWRRASTGCENIGFKHWFHPEQTFYHSGQTVDMSHHKNTFEDAVHCWIKVFFPLINVQSAKVTNGSARASVVHYIRL